MDFFSLRKTDAAQTYSLLLLGGLEDLGYLGEGLLFGQEAANMPPPIMSRNAPAQAMKMAEPNSYLQKQSIIL